MEKWFTYILYSSRIDKYYIGSTDNLEWRLERHNLGWGKFTKGGIPWKLVYHETCQTKSEALKR
jgi:putative endonuclease